MLNINGCRHLHKDTWELDSYGGVETRENTEIRGQIVSDHGCLASFQAPR